MKCPKCAIKKADADECDCGFDLKSFREEISKKSPEKANEYIAFITGLFRIGKRGD